MALVKSKALEATLNSKIYAYFSHISPYKNRLKIGNYGACIKLAQKFLSIKNNLKINSKFSIHPFKSLHAQGLLPLSVPDYIARFSLELLVLLVAAIGIAANVSLSAHANLLEVNDNSVIFSYLRTNPDINTPLIDRNGTTTILARADRLVAQTFAQSPFILLSSKKNENNDPISIQENVVVKTNPADTDNFLRAGKLVYEVVSGDSIITIASSFGVSPQTVMIENKLDEASIIKPGQKLSILPTTGVSHNVLAGETVETIAKKYKVSEDDLLDVNDLELPDDILTGDVLTIPLDKVELPKKAIPRAFVKTETGKIALKQATAPSNIASGLSFIWPTATRQITQGFNRRHSGLDISNSQMVAIYAAEDGFVELSGWQTGYGNTIVINHGNGYRTRYAHTSDLYVSAGEKVAKGQTIAKQGRTGRVRGVTGIHLHFEIIKNGAKVNPLSYVKP